MKILLFILGLSLLSLAIWKTSRLYSIMDSSDIPDCGKISLQKVESLKSKYGEIGYGSGIVLGTPEFSNLSDEETEKFIDDHFPVGEFNFSPFSFGYSRKDKIIYTVDHGKYFREPVHKIMLLCISSLASLGCSAVFWSVEKCRRRGHATEESHQEKSGEASQM